MSEGNEVTTQRDLPEPPIGGDDPDSAETSLPEPPEAALPEVPVTGSPENVVEPEPVVPRRPPRRFRTATLVLVALLSAGLATGITLLVGPHAGGGDASSAGEELYQCPMHPTIVQDHPGECPICGMKLVKVQQAHTKGQPTKSQGNKRILFYRSPMNPAQTSPTPRKDEMGMDYIPVYEGEDGAGEAPGIPGLATVEISAERQQLIGLRTTEVTRGPVGGSWRTVGRVAVDETRVRHVNIKVPGFVEKVFVNYTGQLVKRGRPLFSMYSPELLAAQEEYLLALRTGAVFDPAGPAPTGGARDNPLLSAARRRLELWDVSPAEIDRLTRTREPTRTITFSSPASGVVTKKDVVEGMRLEAGAMPYEIVDLSTVWVLADVYETELRFVHEGMPATLTVDAFPNREFQGTVAFIEPILNPQTRTVKVRITLPNPTGELRPEMFGEVVLQGEPRDALRIPADAIIDSGTEKIVFVALGEGRFQPRRVTAGESDGNTVEIQTGLQQGERVVTRANFLVDSESRLRASLADMTAARSNKAPESARVLPDQGADRPAPQPPSQPQSEAPAGSQHQHAGQP